MSYEDLISKIAREIPELAGKLSVPRVTYVKSLRKTYITFESTVLAGEEQFLKLERVLREAFPGRDLAVRVASPSLREAFLADVSAYRTVLVDFLKRNYPASSVWMDRIDWTCRDGRITLTCPDEFVLHFLSRQNVAGRLTVAIRDIFSAEVSVELTVAGDREERVARMRQERQEASLAMTMADMAERYGTGTGSGETASGTGRPAEKDRRPCPASIRDPN